MRIDPIPNAIIPFTISSDRNARKLNWNNKLFIPQDVTVNYNLGRGVTTELVSEEIVNGKGGSAITFPVITSLPPPDPEDNPPPPGPSVGSDVVYVMGTQYLGRTRDFGSNHPTWGTVSTPAAERYYDFILDPWNPVNNGWLSTSDGLYRSTNLNSVSPSWSLVLSKSEIETITGRSPYHNGYKIIGSINKQDYFAFFFLCGNNTVGVPLYCARTLDSGSSWSIVQASEDESSYFWNGGADYVPHLVNGQVVLYVLEEQGILSPPSAQALVRKSTNSGAGWATTDYVGASGDTVFPHTVHCPYNNNTAGNIAYVAGARIGMYKTTNGTDFSSLGVVPKNNVCRAAAETYTQENNRVYYWGSDNRIYVSDNGGASFGVRGGVPGEVRAVGGFPFNSARYYAVSTTGIYASTDDGHTFVNKTNNYPVSAISPSASYNKAIIVPVWVS
jgi:hypothetical protein